MADIWRSKRLWALEIMSEEKYGEDSKISCLSIFRNDRPQSKMRTVHHSKITSIFWCLRRMCMCAWKSMGRFMQENEQNWEAAEMVDLYHTQASCPVFLWITIILLVWWHIDDFCWFNYNLIPSLLCMDSLLVRRVVGLQERQTARFPFIEDFDIQVGFIWSHG